MTPARRERRALGSWVAAALVAVTLAGCNGGSPSGDGTPKPVTLTVLAASSLTNVFPRIGALYSRSHPSVTVTFSFAGTDQLAAQIEQDAPADVFAGASTKYGDQLSLEHLIDAPRPFCTNRLVLVLPPSNPATITSLEDLTRPGIKLVVGAESVPAGAYTRKVLENLNATYGAGYSDRVLANVVSNEENVEGVLAKVRLGEADAGFVYITDSLAAGSAVTAVELPEAAQAVATYPIARVGTSAHPTEAGAFAAFVLTPPAQALLSGAGFGPPSA